MIDISKRYRTIRDGHKVTIEVKNIDKKFPYFGKIHLPRPTYTCWNDDGKCVSFMTPEYDIVEDVNYLLTEPVYD